MSKTTRGGGLFASALMLLAGVFSLNAQNGIEPRYEKYNMIGSPSKSMVTYLIGPA